MADGPLQIKRFADRPADDKLYGCWGRRDASLVNLTGPARIWREQNTTVRCLDDYKFDPSGPLGGPDANRTSLFGDADAFPDYAGVLAQTRAWLAAHAPGS